MEGVGRVVEDGMGGDGKGRVEGGEEGGKKRKRDC